MKQLLFFMVASLPHLLWAQKAPAQDPGLLKINSICDQVMKHFADGKRQEAMELVWMNTTFLGQQEVDTLAAILDRAVPADRIAQNSLRNPVLISDLEISGFIRERYYLLRLDKGFQFYRFRLYKGKDNWGFSDFSVLEDLPMIAAKELQAPAAASAKAAVDRQCDLFMKFFAEGKIHQAFLELYRNSKEAGSDMDAMEAQVQSIVDEYFPVFGKVLDYKLQKEYSINEFLSRRYYSFRMEQMYFVFNFYIYKGAGDWRVATLDFNSDLPEALFKRK